MALPHGRGAPVYLADGVYFAQDRDRGVITLTTEDGFQVTNTIVLDETTLVAFLSELQRRKIIKWTAFPASEK